MVRRAIPNEDACDQLVELIKEHGMWKEPPSEEEGANAEAAMATA